MKRWMLLPAIVSVMCFLPLHGSAQCVEGNCVDGKGTLINADKGLKYVGEFKNGKRNGKGILFMQDQTKSRGQKQFEGLWKDHIPEGEGTLTFYDGRKFVGQWKSETLTVDRTIPIEGKMTNAKIRQTVLSAQGTMYYPNGKKEVGEFKNDDFKKK
ncbi:MAG: hypothetical protein GXX85_17945 [Ignavibacteria bacterium]|nr:hypothetical protein [Ignavibacteria bacterium]